MHRSSSILPIFLCCVAVSLLFLFLSTRGWLQAFTDNVQLSVFPLGVFLQQTRSAATPQTELTKLQEENAKLLREVAQMNQLKQDNAALRDQFDTTAIPSQKLLPVQVVGMPNVLPNVSFPETLVLHAGEKEGVMSGSIVVVKDEVIGMVTHASWYYSTAQLVTNPSSSFSVKDIATSAIGVAKGQGNGEIVVNNIVLSDTVAVGDSITTSGNQKSDGSGYPPGLIVGKVVSVDKNPSSLFQTARVLPLVHFDRLAMVFVLTK